MDDLIEDSGVFGSQTLLVVFSLVEALVLGENTFFGKPLPHSVPHDIGPRQDGSWMHGEPAIHEIDDFVVDPDLERQARSKGPAGVLSRWR